MAGILTGHCAHPTSVDPWVDPWGSMGKVYRRQAFARKCPQSRHFLVFHISGKDFESLCLLLNQVHLQVIKSQKDSFLQPELTFSCKK